MSFYLEADIEEVISQLKDEMGAFSGKNILVTGGQGFLGRYFQKVFIALNNKLTRPCTLYVVDNLITAGKLGQEAEDNENIHFIKHDIIQPFSSEVDCQFDFILHAAGIASPYYYRAYPLETLEVATVGTKHLLQLAKEHQARFVFFSSSEIYGDPDPRFIPTPESYRGNVAINGPRSCYDISKRLGETLCHIFHDTHGVHTNTIRPFNVYGPGMQENDYRVLPNFAAKLQRGEHLKVYGSGKQTRTYCYITDAIAGMFKVFARGVAGEAYNIGNPEPEVSLEELINTIQKIHHAKVCFDKIDYPDSYPADEPQRRCADITKAKIQLEFQPRVGLQDGLKRFLGWTSLHYKKATSVEGVEH